MASSGDGRDAGTVRRAAGESAAGGRGRRTGLNRAAVARGALRVLDRDGPDGLTMRGVGTELGVQAMSLYNHVRDKDDLLDAIAEEVLGAVTLPASDLPWDHALTALARGLRAAVLAHPHAAPLVASRPLASPVALAPVEAALDALRRAGLSPEDTVEAFWAFTSFIAGALLSEAAARVERRAVSIGPTDLPRGVDAVLPNLAELAPLIAASDYEVEFGRGIDRLLGTVAPRCEGAASPRRTADVRER